MDPVSEPLANAPPPPGPAGAHWRAGMRLLLPAACVLGLILVALGVAAGLARWLLVTEGGSAWLLQRLPMVQVQGWRGTLLGEHWHADRLRVTWGGTGQAVDISALDVEGLRWRWRPDAQSWIAIEASRVHARRLGVATGTAGPRPITLPASLALPLNLAVAQAQVDELVVDTLAPLHGLSLAGLVLDPRPGAEHRIQRVALDAAGVAVTGSLSLTSSAPLLLTADATVRPAADGDTPRWAAVLHARGPLAELQVEATLRGRPGARSQAAPSLDLRATLQPLQAWVLAGLDLQTQALDLSALSPRAPATRLSGQARLSGGAGGSPLTATLALDNALPGRWDERRLPLRRLVLDIQARPQQPDHLDLTRFALDLADARGSAGRWSGSAVWQGHELALNTQLAAVTPQRLDGRAAAMTLSGPLAMTLRGLPSPDPTGATPATPAPSMRWKLDLQGRLDAAPQTVRLQLEGQADDQHLDLQRAHAEAGGASADLSATVARARRGEWQVQTRGTVLDFDPRPWWPGDAAGPWRRGPHRLTGQWQFELSLPSDADRLPPLVLAQRAAGNGSLHIHDSLLAGVAFAADLTLGYKQAAAPAAASVRADLRLGGNQVTVEGRGDPAGPGDDDRWNMTIKGDSLASLAPLAQLSETLHEWVPRQGSASATLSVEGRWPGLRTEGSARVTQLEVGRLQLARGNASWTLDSRGEVPLALRLEVAGLQLGTQRADHLRADLRGTLANHQIDISGALPLVPPAIAEQVLGIELQSGTNGQLMAQGGWRADPAGGGRWRAHVERLVVGSWDGSTVDAPPASGWAETQDLHAELQFDGAYRLVGLDADAGRVRLADTVTLRWDALHMDLRGEQPQLQLRAEIEPFALAPLLARAQPGMGWQGDLRLAARVDIRAGERVDADLVFERRDGDLNASSGEAMQLLGLTDLRVALAVHDGVWNFTQILRGRSLGEITGQVRVQATPEQRWPQPDAPIDGRLQARVADLGIWSSWVPPGWRMAGTLRTSATLGGRWGEPQYSGEISGSGLGVRNLLEGVNVSDGEVRVTLAGETAQVERFSFKGGEGSLAITGSAALGRTPQARLQMKAQRFRVLGRVDRQLIASGNAELVLQAEHSRLEGRFTIDEGLFDASRSNAPTLDDDVVVHRAGERPDPQAEAGKPRTRSDFDLAVDVDLGDKLRLRGRGLDTTLVGTVRLTTPGGRLAVNGSIRTESGTYAAYGQKLTLDHGIVSFGGPPDNPRLDVLALRPNIDYRVGVAITGTLLTPRVRLYSDPDMSDSDKLSWLVLGRAPDGLGRNDTALLQRAAVALLSGEGEAPTDALLKTLGIDDVSLRQGDTDVHETVVSIGKQLTRRWYLSYERGVNATTGNWQLTYRIAQRFTLRLQSGLDNAVDVIWTWRFGEPPPNASIRKSVVVPR